MASTPQHNVNLNTEAHSSAHQHNREKRHSFTSLSTSHHNSNTNRHSAEILSPENEVSTHSQKHAHIPERHRRIGDLLNVNTVQLPAPYIALFPYKPQKADELELRKGGIYMVTERCQDGWFKGTSNRTQKCGVFPGNYVILAQNVPRSPIAAPRSNDNSGDSKSSGSHNRSGKSSLVPKHNLSNHPPELPPRSSSPATVTNTISSSWHGQQDNAALSIGRSSSAIMTNTTTHLTVSTTTPKSSDKVCDCLLILLFTVALLFIIVVICATFHLFFI